MSTIDDYLAAYERQFDYWDGAARQARTILQAGLRASGIRAITSSRAKSVDRLATKLRERDIDHHYATADDITNDIVDLAGVRVSLYFPGQIQETADLIHSLFDVTQERYFPEGPADADDTGRPGGYRARHFRVLIPDEALARPDARYSSAPVEIQVASVLMHAWSEVEHDLSYKPGEATLSTREVRLLRQLNNLVADGENNLQRLQTAIDRRVRDAEGPFRDHYELAEYLRGYRAHNFAPEASATPLGPVDHLFDYLRAEGLARTDHLADHLEQLSDEDDGRPLAEQLIDLLVAGDADAYRAYRTAGQLPPAWRPARRPKRPDINSGEADYEAAYEAFLTAWVDFEKALERCLSTAGRRTRGHTLTRNTRDAVALGAIDEETAIALGEVQDMRHRLVHRRSDPLTDRGRQLHTERMTAATAYLGDVSAQLRTAAERPQA